MAQPKIHRFSPCELQNFRQILDSARKAMINTEQDVEGEGLLDLSEDVTGEISHARTHAADLGSNEFQRDLMLILAENESREIRDIEDALAKLQNQTYGNCEECGVPIPVPRLQVLPHTRYCGTCELRLEKRRRDRLHKSRLT